MRFEAAKGLGDLHASEYAAEVGALYQYSGGTVEDNQVKRTAIQALTKMGTESAHFLLPFLQDEDKRVRQEAEREIAGLGGVERLQAQAAENTATLPQAAQDPAEDE